MHRLGRTYGRRPSEILQIEDAWAGYQLDVAVLNFGTWVENELQETDKQGRPKRSLEQLLAPATTDDGQRTTRRRPAPRPESEFRSPVLMGLPIRKVKPNADGTW